MKKTELQRLKRHKNIKLRMEGTKEIPRLVVHRSIKNLTASLVDDVSGRILFSMSTFDKEIRQKFPSAGNIKAAEFFGEVFARKSKDKGVVRIIFDRAGYLYHGRIKAFADSLRKHGIQF